MAAAKKISEPVLDHPEQGTYVPSISERALATVKPRRVRKSLVQVTRTVLKQVNGETLSVIFESEFEQAPPIKRRGKAVEDEDKKPPMIAKVEDFDTGTKHFLIGNTVLLSELTEQYPDGAYVGKAFEITPSKGAKDYKTYSIAEIEFEVE